MRSATVPMPSASLSPPVSGEPDASSPGHGPTGHRPSGRTAHAEDHPADSDADRLPSGETLALYFHWPFCVAKCPYCDFNSHVRAHVDHQAWATALCRELDHLAAETRGRTVTSVFFGGGTPSLMPAGTVAALLDRVAAQWTTAPDIEITLEANPTSVEADRFAGFRSAGINRVSLGIQAFDEAALKLLGRNHDRAQAEAALEIAARLFQRYSFDLIMGRPGQTLTAWQTELASALERAGDHLSIYQLTIEPHTRFEAMVRRGDLVPLDDDTQAAFYELTQDRMAAAGMPAYELSNHARPGGACRHNLSYWRLQDYAGIGPGAHGRLTIGGRRLATRTHRAPEIWLQRVTDHGHGEHPRTPITPRETLEEALMMGLRLTEGIALARLERQTGQPLAAWIPQPRIDRLVAAGLLQHSTTRLRATAAGRQRLDAVLRHLLV